MQASAPSGPADGQRVSSLSQLSRHVLNLERRLVRLKAIIYPLSQAALGRLELDQLAHRIQACEQHLDLRPWIEFRVRLGLPLVFLHWGFLHGNG